LYRLSFKNKVGLIADGSKVTIYQPFNGRLIVFYDYTPKGIFNCPKGTYYTRSKLKVVKAKVKKIVLPKRERIFAIPKDVAIKSTKTKHKCVIHKASNTIYYDRTFFKDLTPTEKYFIFCHEIGHYLYTTEHKADLYAANCLLKSGYNESQIAKLPFKTLGDNQTERKIKMLNAMINKKKLIKKNVR